MYMSYIVESIDVKPKEYLEIKRLNLLLETM